MADAALQSFSSQAAYGLYDRINAALSPDQLDNASRAVSHHWGKGEINDDDATFLYSAINKRRPPGRCNSHVPGLKPIGKLLGRVGSLFAKPRKPQRSPDRKASRERRRILGGSNDMPPNVRKDYTEGERAVLTIIAGEVKHHGVCDLPIDKIAALAGCCRTTVQNALHAARRNGHLKITDRPQRHRKNLPNLVEIISREWRAWIRRGPTAHRPDRVQNAKIVNPTKNIGSNNRYRFSDVAAAAAAQGARRWEPGARSSPHLRR
jgi:hypothetical protein